MRLQDLSQRPAIRFLLVGGSISLLNWTLRFVFSLFLDFQLAVVMAGCVAIIISYVAYRNLVFRTGTPLSVRSVTAFLFTNAVGLLVTVLIASGGLMLLRYRGLGGDLAAGLSHALGILAGAAATYPLHKLVTFRP